MPGLNPKSSDTDAFSLVSGFYGPGALSCWYLLVVSVVITWIVEPRHRFKVNNDFIAALLYPVIACGHVLIQTLHCPPQDLKDVVGEVTALLKRRSPSSSPPEAIGVRGHKTLMSDGKAVFFDALPRAVAINAALRVTETFVWILFAIFITIRRQHIEPPRLFHLLVRAALAWCLFVEVCLCVFLGHGFGHLQTRSFLAYAHVPTFIYGGYCTVVFVAWLVPYSVCRLFEEYPNLAERYARFDRSLFSDLFLNGRRPCLTHVEFFWMLEGVVIFLVIACVKSSALLALFFPASGISIRELDQTAALLGGLFTLGMNISGILRNIASGNRDVSEVL